MTNWCLGEYNIALKFSDLANRVAAKLGEDLTEVKEAAALLAILGWRDGSSREKATDRYL